MKVERLQRMLAAYGLSETEVRAFYCLGKLGEATATEVAKESGLSRAEVYRAADGLEARGLIERTVDRPQRFLPRPIEDALTRLLSDERTRLESLESDREALAAGWPQRGGAEEADEERFQVQRGRTQIEGRLRRMLQDAKREVALAMPHRTVNRLLSWGLGPDLVQCVSRGVAVRVLTQLTEDMMDGPTRLPDGCDVRHSEVPTYAQFAIVDQNQIAIYVTADPVIGATGRPETLLWMNSPDFTMGQQTLFDDLWIKSTDPAARRHELATGFPPRMMRVVRGRLPRVDEARALVAGATKHVAVALPESDDAFARKRMAKELKRAAARGVAVDVRAEGDWDDIDGQSGIERVAGGFDPRVALVVVDERVALVAFADAPDAGDERALVLTVPVAVTLLSRWFQTGL